MKAKHKKKILKAAKEKDTLFIDEQRKNMQDFLSETMQPQRQYSDIFKQWKKTKPAIYTQWDYVYS